MISPDAATAPRFAVLPPRQAEHAPEAEAPQEDAGGFKPFGKDGFSFLDVLDVVNPLQHIPVVSSLYRAWTGDTIDPAPRIAGGGLFGGPFGALAGLVNVIVESISGRDVGENVLALFEDEAAPQPPTNVAASPTQQVVTAAVTARAIAPPASRVPPAAPVAEPVVAAAFTENRTTAAALPGATALEGGWFTESMLIGLDKYQKSAALAAPRPGTRVDAAF